MTSIYVPSRQRSHLLKKTAITWVDASIQGDMDIFIVVDDEEVDTYRAEVRKLGFNGFIDVLPDTSVFSGIGAARQTCLEHAEQRGDEFTIQVDDDMKVTARLWQLVEALEDNPMASGCGAWQSYYGLGFGKEGPDVFRNYTSMGLQVKSYRVQPLMYYGGFDPGMKLAEDVDAVMKVAMATGQFPLIHRRVKATSVNQRGDEGGCASQGGHSSHAARTVEILNGRYGEGTASLREHKRTGLPRDTIWMAKFWKRVESGYYA